MKNIVIDPGTFGKSAACHTLVNMMNDNIISISQKHKVLAFINKCIVSFNAVNCIKNQSIRHNIILLMRESYLLEINKMKYPIIFSSFLKNIIIYHSKRFI